MPNIKLVPRQDGEYDILIEYSKADVEFAWEFGKRKNKHTNSEGILKSWRRKCVNARIELETLNSNQRKALIMAVYYPCIDYIDEYISEIDDFSQESIRRYIDELKNEAVRVIEERKKDYNYGVKNNIIVENLIFELIDSCFLSFESY